MLTDPSLGRCATPVAIVHRGSDSSSGINTGWMWVYAAYGMELKLQFEYAVNHFQNRGSVTI